MPELEIQLLLAGVAGVGNRQFVDVIAGDKDIFFHRSKSDGMGNIPSWNKGIGHEFNSGDFQIGGDLQFKLFGVTGIKVGESGAVFEGFKALKLAI